MKSKPTSLKKAEKRQREAAAAAATDEETDEATTKTKKTSKKQSTSNNQKSPDRADRARGREQRKKKSAEKQAANEDDAAATGGGEDEATAEETPVVEGAPEGDVASVSVEKDDGGANQQKASGDVVAVADNPEASSSNDGKDENSDSDQEGEVAKDPKDDGTISLDPKKPFKEIDVSAIENVFDGGSNDDVIDQKTKLSVKQKRCYDFLEDLYSDWEDKEFSFPYDENGSQFYDHVQRFLAMGYMGRHDVFCEITMKSCLALHKLHSNQERVSEETDNDLFALALPNCAAFKKLYGNPLDLNHAAVLCFFSFTPDEIRKFGFTNVESTGCESIDYPDYVKRSHDEVNGGYCPKLKSMNRKPSPNEEKPNPSFQVLYLERKFTCRELNTTHYDMAHQFLDDLLDGGYYVFPHDANYDEYPFNVAKLLNWATNRFIECLCMIGQVRHLRQYFRNSIKDVINYLVIHDYEKENNRYPMPDELEKHRVELGQDVLDRFEDKVLSIVTMFDKYIDSGMKFACLLQRSKKILATDFTKKNIGWEFETVFHDPTGKEEPFVDQGISRDSVDYKVMQYYLTRLDDQKSFHHYFEGMFLVSFSVSSHRYILLIL